MCTKTVVGILVLLMLFSLYFVYYLKSDAGYSKFPLNSSRFNLTMKKSKKTPIAQLELDFQVYLKSIQEPRNCSAVEVLRCGHNYPCGLGCQIHHRIACAVISNAIGIPWLYDENSSWSFNDPWTTYLKPVGTKCKNARHVRWVKKWKDYRSQLVNGFPVPNFFVQRLRRLHRKPFLWFVGQFTKFVFQITPGMQTTIKRLKEKLGMASSRNMGLHVRRSDKIQELTKGYVRNERYFQEIHEYHKKIKSGENLTVLVTSEDHRVLPLFKRRFQHHPSVRIVGFEAKKTAKHSTDRRPYLFSIVRDIMLLAECDYVVCTYSSNVCRLILEMRIGQGLQESSVKSLDMDYHFRVREIDLKEQTIIPF